MIRFYFFTIVNYLRSVKDFGKSIILKNLTNQEDETPTYSEFDRIPVDKYKGLNIQRNYMGGDLPLDVGPYKGERYSIGDMKNIGLNQSDITHPIGDLPFNLYDSTLRFE